MAKNKILLIGLGNILLRDDGVGVHVIRSLGQKYYFIPHVEVIDGGTMGLDLLPFFESADKVLIVDAADFAVEPGHISEIEDDEIPNFVQSKFSVHQIGLSDLLSALKMIDIRPSKICLIGIQPESIDVGLNMTDRISLKMDQLISMAIRKLEEWGVRCASPFH